MKSRVLIMILSLAMIFCSACEEVPSECIVDVDLQEDEDEVDVSKVQLGGYQAVRLTMMSVETSSQYEAKRFYMVIGRAGNPKQDRQLIRVTKKLWINTDEREVFPKVIEKKEDKKENI